MQRWKGTRTPTCVWCASRPLLVSCSMSSTRRLDATRKHNHHHHHHHSHHHHHHSRRPTVLPPSCMDSPSHNLLYLIRMGSCPPTSQCHHMVGATASRTRAAMHCHHSSTNTTLEDKVATSSRAAHTTRLTMPTMLPSQMLVRAEVVWTWMSPPHCPASSAPSVLTRAAP